MDVFQIVKADLNEIILKREHVVPCFRNIYIYIYIGITVLALVECASTESEKKKTAIQQDRNERLQIIRVELGHKTTS